jgi:predicted nucleic acid-binding protein
MNLVTDTHVLVWYTSGQLRRLSRRARRAFAEAEAGRSTIRVPTIVLMEVILLEERGRLRVAYRELREQLALRSGLPERAADA